MDGRSVAEGAGKWRDDAPLVPHPKRAETANLYVFLEDLMEVTLEERLQSLSNTSKGLGLIQTMLDRGDFTADDASYVRKWLRKELRRRRKEYLDSAEGSSIRQANAAERALWISLLALVVSVLALYRTW